MPIPPPTKRDQIIDELRRLILSGNLPRGTKLPQDELARQFQSSITPVREALRALEADSLVVSEPRRGVRVASVNFDRATATYIIRRLTESYAMRRAAIRLSPLELAQAEVLLTQVNEAVSRLDTEAARALNRKFHFFFYERCGLPALVDEIDALWRVFPWDMLLDSPVPAEASDVEHRAILDAVRAGDAEAAGTAMEKHLSRSFIALNAQYSGGLAADPFDITTD